MVVVFIIIGNFTSTIKINNKQKKIKNMKGHLIVIASVAVAVTIVLMVRDNMPKGSFSFKK